MEGPSPRGVAGEEGGVHARIVCDRFVFHSKRWDLSWTVTFVTHVDYIKIILRVEEVLSYYHLSERTRQNFPIVPVWVVVEVTCVWVTRALVGVRSGVEGRSTDVMAPLFATPL